MEHNEILILMHRHSETTPDLFGLFEGCPAGCMIEGAAGQTQMVVPLPVEDTKPLAFSATDSPTEPMKSTDSSGAGSPGDGRSDDK